MATMVPHESASVWGTLDQRGSRVAATSPLGGAGALLDRMVEVGGGLRDPRRRRACAGALAAAGMIGADDAGGAYPFDLTGGVLLLVEQEDAEDAAAVLGGRTDSDGKGQR